MSEDVEAGPKTAMYTQCPISNDIFISKSRGTIIPVYLLQFLKRQIKTLCFIKQHLKFERYHVCNKVQLLCSTVRQCILLLSVCNLFSFYKVWHSSNLPLAATKQSTSFCPTLLWLKNNQPTPPPKLGSMEDVDSSQAEINGGVDTATNAPLTDARPTTCTGPLFLCLLPIMTVSVASVSHFTLCMFILLYTCNYSVIIYGC